MRLRVLDYTSRSTVGGALAGETFFARLITATSGISKDDVLLLDFEGMDLATASFLRAGVLAFRDFCLSNHRGVVVVANLNDEIREELAMLLSERRDAMAACRLTKTDKITAPVIIGALDEKQTITLDAVLDGHTDTGTMHRAFSKTEKVGLTAWSNRISSLVAKGLVVEMSQGRAKVYRPIFEGLTYGR